MSTAAATALDQDGYATTGYGVVHPWLCDAMGHLTTRNYMALFDDAVWQMFATVGYDAATAGRERWGWADVQHELSYLHEVPVGALVEVRSRVTQLGRASISAAHRLVGRSDGALLASMTGKTVCFDLDARKSRPLPDLIRERAEAIFGAFAGDAS